MAFMLYYTEDDSLFENCKEVKRNEESSDFGRRREYPQLCGY